VRAVVLRAEWAPRGEVVTRESTAQGARDVTRIAARGNVAWRAPRLGIEQRPDPVPGRDTVVIRVRACGICGSDVHLRERDADGYMLYPGMVGTPVVIGHEFSGVVEAVGPDVVDVAAGDAVCAEEIAWCGECLACRSGLPNNCTRLEELGFTFDGAHAERVAVRARYVWSLRPLLEAGIDDRRVHQLGALVEPTSVAWIGLFISAGGFAPGSSVGVAGAGPIGLAAIALARAAGAARVVAFEPSATRRSIALAVGADEVHDPRALGSAGLANAAREATRGRGFDRWIEASGARGVAEPMAASLAPGGRVVLIGRGPHTIDLDPEWLIVRGAGVVGSIGHAGSGAFGRVIDLMATGRLPMDRIVSTTVPLDGMVAALEELGNREAGKTIVEP
jgi:threonine dehydrogenase-like Zn-dependent dehydrogenase